VVPLMREGEAIGTIAIRRPEARPFSDQQVKLIETFAAQAVIAIENVRLFNETKESLEQPDGYPAGVRRNRAECCQTLRRGT